MKEFTQSVSFLLKRMAIKCLNLYFRIGFAIAKKLAEDGADVVISSRKQKNVDKAVNALKALNLSVTGLVCHVGKPEDRQRLLQKVSWSTNQINLQMPHFD